MISCVSLYFLNMVTRKCKITYVVHICDSHCSISTGQRWPSHQREEPDLSATSISSACSTAPSRGWTWMASPTRTPTFFWAISLRPTLPPGNPDTGQAVYTCPGHRKKKTRENYYQWLIHNSQSICQVHASAKGATIWYKLWKNFYKYYIFLWRLGMTPQGKWWEIWEVGLGKETQVLQVRREWDKTLSGR